MTTRELVAVFATTAIMFVIVGVWQGWGLVLGAAITGLVAFATMHSVLWIVRKL